jgi:hypothetical protein
MESNKILEQQNTYKLFLYLVLAITSLSLVLICSLCTSFKLIDYFTEDLYTKWQLSKKTILSTSILIINLPILWLSFTAIHRGIMKSKFSLNSKLLNWTIYVAITISIIVVMINFSCLIYWLLAGDLTTPIIL